MRCSPLVYSGLRTRAIVLPTPRRLAMRHESRFCSSVDITAMTRSAEGTPASTCVSMLMPLPSTVMTSSVLPMASSAAVRVSTTVIS